MSFVQASNSVLFHKLFYISQMENRQIFLYTGLLLNLLRHGSDAFFLSQ